MLDGPRVTRWHKSRGVVDRVAIDRSLDVEWIGEDNGDRVAMGGVYGIYRDGMK